MMLSKEEMETARASSRAVSFFGPALTMTSGKQAHASPEEAS